MDKLEIVEQLADSKAFEFDSREEWWEGQFEHMQIDCKNSQFRIREIGIFYEESTDMFEVVGMGGWTIIKFYGSDVRKLDATKTVFIELSDCELHFN